VTPSLTTDRSSHTDGDVGATEHVPLHQAVEDDLNVIAPGEVTLSTATVPASRPTQTVSISRRRTSCPTPSITVRRALIAFG
jgi:hypothetical protein